MYEVQAIADMLLMTSHPEPAKATELEALQVSPDASLVRAVLAGDREAFSTLYAQFAPLVHGILLARVPRLEVEDLVQDIFLHAYRKLHTLRDGAAFGPWIAMIPRNRAMDFNDRMKR
jgi:RNA polymerase sigma-70 factor (ECF subfamily)